MEGGLKLPTVVSVAETILVSVTGDVWQGDGRRERGANETYTFNSYPDFARLLDGYERRHGSCSSFTVQITK